MGARLKCRDGGGWTVLSWAAENGHEVTFKRLIDNGADVESRDDLDRTILHYAIRNGNEAIVGMLLDLGVDPEPRDKFGGSPLHWAAWNGNKAIVRILLERGADFDCRDEDEQSPLHYAAESGSEAAVRMLLEIGADDQVRDNAGHTPLSLATERGHEVIIQLLQQHADSPASRQSSEAYHSVPYNAWDITAGISSAEIDLNSVPTLYKKVGQDWHALFDPQLQRDLDVDLVHVLEHSFPVTSVRFSHDGMHIATSSHRTARIFDIQTGEQVRVLDHNIPHTDQSIYISSVSFSPDDHYLATGGDNGMVCVSQFPACIQLQLN
ncbi:general transcription repressor [Fusarium solani]